MSKILLSHGDGGGLTRELLETVFYPHLQNSYLAQQSDAACLPQEEGRLAVTTDSFVIKPLFFPGGDIGKLAVCGTVNDLAVSGATPRFLTAGFIIEEGFDIESLKKIVESLALTSQNAGVQVVAGDTKVVEKGHGDGVFINTTGVGIIHETVKLGYGLIQPGDKIIINGNIGDHGSAVLTQREGIRFTVESDCAPLGDIIGLMLNHFSSIKLMRDPTRGGVATTLKEIALMSHVDFYLDETKLPISEEVKSLCDIFGLDPLYLANEGKFIAIVGERDCQEILHLLHRHPLGKNACCIGDVQQGRGNVFVKTAIGGTKRIDFYPGGLLPRIC
ncbi:MAG: hydrogenase expression/formation protein HypE [Dehalobacterium sp.]